jgi:hypothetical protein
MNFKWRSNNVHSFRFPINQFFIAFGYLLTNCKQLNNNFLLLPKKISPPIQIRITATKQTMKIVASLLSVFLSSVVVVVSSAADVENCDLQLVADATTCNTYCVQEQGYNASYYIPVTAHRDTMDDNHVDILIGFECHCHSDDDADGHTEDSGGRRRELAEEDGHTEEGTSGLIDHSQHLICWVSYTFPTCEEVNMACDEHHGDEDGTTNTTTSVARNATTTATFGSCDEYCSSIGLGSASSFCHHMMSHGEHGEEEDPDHTHEEDVELSLCFCDSEAVGQGFMTCGDGAWENEEGHDDDHMDGANSISMTSLLVAVVSMLVTMMF